MAEIGLSGLAGLILSVFFDWFPYVRGKFDQLEEQGKRLVMLAALIVATGALLGVSCIPGSPFTAVECSESGIWDVVNMFMAALVTNQGGHALLKPVNKDS